MSRCQSLGGYLAVFETEEEDRWILNYRQANAELGNIRIWLGGYHDDFTNQWKWTSPNGESLVRYFNWHQGEPSHTSQDCIVLFDRGRNYEWDDGDCGGSLEFLCEK